MLTHVHILKSFWGWSITSYLRVRCCWYPLKLLISQRFCKVTSLVCEFVLLLMQICKTTKQYYMTAEYFRMNYSSDTYTLVFQKNLVSGRGSAGKKFCVAPRNLYILEWVPGIIAKIIHRMQHSVIFLLENCTICIF